MNETKMTNFRLDYDRRSIIEKMPGSTFTQKLLYIIDKGIDSLKTDRDMQIRLAITNGPLHKCRQYQSEHPDLFYKVCRDVVLERKKREDKATSELNENNTSREFKGFTYRMDSNNKLLFNSMYEYIYVQYIFDRYKIKYDTMEKHEEFGYDYIIKLEDIKDLEKCV